KIHETYGKVVCTAKNVALVSDIESYKFLNGYKYKKGKLYSAFDLKNPNIFSSREKEFHSKRKRLLSPAFNAKSMQAMEPIILQTGTLNLIDYLSNEMELSREAELRVNVLEILYRSTLDVISKLVFGESLNCIDNPEDFKYYMKMIFRAQIILGTSPIIPFIKRYLPTAIFETIIVENMKIRRLEKTQHSDILQSMLDTQDENTGKKLRDDEIIDEAITLLFAGIDTTSNTLIFTIYEILKNRDLYNRITGQILKEFPDPNAKITVEDCRKRLSFLEATLFESLRYYPVAFGPIPRIVPSGGVTIDGRFIPEDTVIAYNTFAVNRNEEYFPTPNEFNIDKWLSPEKEVYKSRLYAFSTGPRGCIGKELAWTEMLLILSHLLHRFNI
ncbi:cytochrome P450, partial [Conidiobolus coronatus NRRL 28638]